jgi:hypothetical protein
MSFLRKAFLSAALATTLVAGGEQAFAQGRYDADYQNGQTQTYRQQKPWANDENYRRQLDSYITQKQLREEAYDRQIATQLRAVENNKRVTMTNLASQYPAYAKQGWSGQLRYTALVDQYNSNFELQRGNLKTNQATYHSQEDQRYDAYVLSLDTQYGNLPQYKNKAPTTQNSSTVQAPADDVHAKLVKKYNDTYVAVAGSGRPLPKAEDFGLSKDDPDIYPNNVRKNTPTSQYSPRR